MSRFPEENMSTASDVSFDPYGDLPVEYTNPPPLTAPQQPQQQQQQPSAHMPYGNYQQAHTMHVAQPMYITVVHPSGRTAWVPVPDGASLNSVKEEACRQLGVQDATQLARVTPMLEDTPMASQCMPNDTLYILPTKTAPENQQQQPQQQQAAAPMYQDLQTSQPVSPLNPSMPSTPLSMSGSFPTAASMYHNAPSSFSQSNTQLSMSGSVNWQQPSLEEKLATAATSLTTIISQSRHCTELQQDLETAYQAGIDCSAVFQTAEAMLPDLILHPSGNYLVSKCFELCPTLIDRAVDVITSDVRMYALHKHGSYVVEAILVSQNASKEAKGGLISSLLSPTNRVGVATHDSGNFVLQKAIENCPDELLMLLQDAVQAVFRMSTHGPKMLKKLESRISKSQQAQNVHVAPVAQTSTLPLPASTVTYVNHEAPTAVEQPEEHKQEVVEAKSIKKVEMKEVRNTRKEAMRVPTSTHWADVEGPLSPPPLFTESCVPLP